MAILDTSFIGGLDFIVDFGIRVVETEWQRTKIIAMWFSVKKLELPVMFES